MERTIYIFQLHHGENKLHFLITSWREQVTNRWWCLLCTRPTCLMLTHWNINLWVDKWTHYRNCKSTSFSSFSLTEMEQIPIIDQGLNPWNTAHLVSTPTNRPSIWTKNHMVLLYLKHGQIYHSKTDISFFFSSFLPNIITNISSN